MGSKHHILELISEPLGGNVPFVLIISANLFFVPGEGKNYRFSVKFDTKNT